MKLCYLIILLMLASPSVIAQSDYTKKEVISYTQGLDIRELDRRLPHARLDRWLRYGPPHLNTVIWQVSRDCDQSNSVVFEIPKEDDWPLCVRFSFGRAGLGDYVKWEMNHDCDLKPLAGELKDDMSCLKSSLEVVGSGSGVDGWGLITVGTRNKGISGRPRLRGMVAGTPVGGYFAGELSDIPSMLKKASSLTKSDREMLTYARTLDVQNLDPSLPSQSFEDWLRSGPAHVDNVVWEMSPTCDLKDPNTPSPTDWFVCVRFAFMRGDSGDFALMVVGTRHKGINGQPHLDHLTLSDIPVILDRHDAEKEATNYVTRLDVMKLDSTLSSLGLDKWLHSGPAHLDHVRWEEGVPCSNQPESSKPEDVFHVCVYLTFWRNDISGSGIIVVGMRGKEVSESPRLKYFEIPAWVTLYEQQPARRSTKLSDLPRLLDEASSQVSRQ